MSVAAVIQTLREDPNVMAFAKTVGPDLWVVGSRMLVSLFIEVLKALAGRESSMTKVQAYAAIEQAATAEEWRAILRHLVEKGNERILKQLSDEKQLEELLWKVLAAMGPVLLASLL